LVLIAGGIALHGYSFSPTLKEKLSIQILLINPGQCKALFHQSRKDKLPKTSIFKQFPKQKTCPIGRPFFFPQ
jgi:hypothetical protein